MDLSSMSCVCVVLLLCGVGLLFDKANAALTVDQKTAILNEHNNYRRDEGASDMRYMSWSDDLANVAQDWADGCVFQHNDVAYGENLFAISPLSGVDVTQAVEDWFDEKPDYDYSTTTCAAGEACGHYTQVVWANTSEVGCGMAVCNSLTSFGSGTYVVCNYDPPGNYQGQQPYSTTGDPCTACDNGVYNCYDNMCMTDCSGVTCECKACEVCQNCADISADCTCQCDQGWTGNLCNTECVNLQICSSWSESNCGEWWMPVDCPAVCGLCELDDGDAQCTVSGQEFCGISGVTSDSSSNSDSNSSSSTTTSSSSSSSGDEGLALDDLATESLAVHTVGQPVILLLTLIAVSLVGL